MYLNIFWVAIVYSDYFWTGEAQYFGEPQYIYLYKKSVLSYICVSKFERARKKPSIQMT